MSNPSEADDLSMIEKEHHVMTLTEIAPLGFGNPDAKIRIDAERLEKPNEEAAINKAGEFIHSGELFVPVDNSDDGCIDGRIAHLVTFINSQNLEEQSTIADEGHERAKVAGGGYMTSLAMYIAVKFNTGSVDSDLAAVVDVLTKEGVYCGAHTGEHSDPNDGVTDCGANDKIDKILLAAVEHAANIRETTKALLAFGGVVLDEDVEAATDEKVQSAWKAATESDYFNGSNGDTRMAVIKEGMIQAQVASGANKPAAVSKDLAGSHKEAFIVVNFTEGVTMSQRQLQTKLQAEFPDTDPKELPQAFVVDAWRIVQLATALNKADESLDMTELLYSGVAYQLATAATLTDGSLRVILAE